MPFKFVYTRISFPANAYIILHRGFKKFHTIMTQRTPITNNLFSKSTLMLNCAIAMQQITAFAYKSAARVFSAITAIAFFAYSA